MGWISCMRILILPVCWSKAKSARMQQIFLAKHFVAVTWPGGSKGDWKGGLVAIKGAKVFAWADCDAKRDKQYKVLPESEQPGMKQ